MDEAKRKLVREWLTIAQHDLASAQKLACDPDAYFDTALFHCQQAAEKAVKAFLVFHDQPFEKTHDIDRLINLALPIQPGFSSLFDEAELLTQYAVSLRYPDENVEPDREEFNRALAAVNKIFNAVLALLPGEVNPARADKNNSEV
jgi:HEPN domain-containing protein